MVFLEGFLFWAAELQRTDQLGKWRDSETEKTVEKGRIMCLLNIQLNRNLKIKEFEKGKRIRLFWEGSI